MTDQPLEALPADAEVDRVDQLEPMPTGSGDAATEEDKHA